jgi:MFS family permease
MSYFQSAAFESVGLTDQTQKMNATLGNACQQFFFAMIGARLVDVVGRRPLLLFSNIGCAIVWVAISVCAAHVAKDGGNVAAGDVGLFFMFLFGTVYSIGFTPLQALYPVEVLSFEMRAKGMAFSALCMNIGKIPSSS